MSNGALRMLLWLLGQCIAQGSRFMPSVRSQITRTLTFQLSAGDHVTRYWSFDGQLRRVPTRAAEEGARSTVCLVRALTDGPVLVPCQDEEIGATRGDVGVLGGTERPIVALAAVVVGPGHHRRRLVRSVGAASVVGPL